MATGHRHSYCSPSCGRASVRGAAQSRCQPFCENGPARDARHIECAGSWDIDIVTVVVAHLAVSGRPDLSPGSRSGIRRIMFAVEDIEDVIARLRTHGAELV